MNKKDIYQIWAPLANKWSRWVRPVPFFYCEKPSTTYQTQITNLPFIPYQDKLDSTWAIIVDLPGISSIKQGLSLAKSGFIPIPVYNGTEGNENSRNTVDNQAIATCLYLNAKLRQSIQVPDNANPAFLMDENRLNRFQANRSIFDNSWDIYHQDLPTGKYLFENGINKVLVDSSKIHKDLRKILKEYKAHKIQIYLYTKGKWKRKLFL